jgi:hypothetical protein
VVHRDIKPHNIMVDHNGVLKVGDFGIAHVADENMSMTKTGSVMGTWGYMAPEQRASARDVDARADLYSAAATWYTLMTNQLPSDLFAVDLDETMFQAVPESVQALMRRATRYKPEDRFEDSEAMIAAVEELLETLPEDSGQYPRPGADLDEDSLGIGRRGATIVPHSDSTERSESRSAPTYAGGVLSERIEGGPLMAPAGVSGTLFDGEDDEEVESTDFRIGRKNRIAFGLGMLVTLGVGATLLFGPERADEAVDGAQNVIEDNGQEALRSASLDEASGSTVAESSLPSVSPDSEKMAGEPTPADSLPEAAPASKTVVETEAVQAESSETVEEDNSGSELEPAVVRPRGQRVRNRIRNRVETRLGADNSPAQLTYLSSVPVRGAVEALQVCYLVSQETGKRFQMPFNRIPGGTYTLRYKFSGAQGGVRDAATLLEVAEGTTPRIRCLARTGVCTVAN